MSCHLISPHSTATMQCFQASLMPVQNAGRRPSSTTPESKNLRKHNVVAFVLLFSKFAENLFGCTTCQTDVMLFIVFSFPPGKTI